MDSAFIKTISGQIILIICCVFYLIWWSISYRPGVEVNRVGGVNGVLLLITMACGIAGVALSISGVRGIPRLTSPRLDGNRIWIFGIAVYVVLLLVTRFLFNRQVTTELFLITAWVVLELTLINDMNAGGYLNGLRFGVSCGILAAAFVISMILYVLYYRMEPMKAFYAAMVPLITEAACMGGIVLLAVL